MSDLPASRQSALDELAHGLWPGTGDLLSDLVRESRGPSGWKPGRAALMRGLGDVQPRVWMHPHELRTWVFVAKALNKRMGMGTTAHQADLGITGDRLNDLMDEKRAAKRNLSISKPLAMACAHYALGLPKPVQTGDDEALLAWFTPRFGNLVRVGAFLDVQDDWLRARLRGWDLRDGQRVDRQPEGYMIRALDWLYRMGPICPYGDRPVTAVFPGQEVTS